MVVVVLLIRDPEARAINTFKHRANAPHRASNGLLHRHQRRLSAGLFHSGASQPNAGDSLEPAGIVGPWPSSVRKTFWPRQLVRVTHAILRPSLEIRNRHR